MLEIKDKPRFKKWVSNQVPSNFLMSNKDRASNPMSQNGRSGNLPCGKLTYDKCSKKHSCEFLMGTGNFFGCVKDGHKVRDCPNMSIQAKRSINDQSSVPNSDAPKRNYFYALRSRGKQEESRNVVTSQLQVFPIDVYDLLDPGATLLFVSPQLSKKLEV